MFFNKNKLLKVKMTFSIIIEFDYFNSSIEKSFSDGIFFSWACRVFSTFAGTGR